MHGEAFLIARTGWLHPAIPGANDALLSSECPIVGVASASGDKGAVMVSELAGLMTGAVSMAAGEALAAHERDELRGTALMERPPSRQHRCHRQPLQPARRAHGGRSRAARRQHAFGRASGHTDTSCGSKRVGRADRQRNLRRGAARDTIRGAGEMLATEAVGWLFRTVAP